MTIVGALLDDLRRSVARAPRRVPVIHRYFRVDEESTLLALVSDQPSPKEAPTLVLVHGLTGSADAGYMRSTAAKLYQRGFNVVRVNVRNWRRHRAADPNALSHGADGGSARAARGPSRGRRSRPHQRRRLLHGRQHGAQAAGRVGQRSPQLPAGGGRDLSADQPGRGLQGAQPGTAQPGLSTELFEQPQGADP